MLEFDPRIVGPQIVAFLRACQACTPFHLAGGAALAGVHLRHRISGDADLFVHSPGDHRDLARALPSIGAEIGVSVHIVRDSGPQVRAVLPGLEPPIEIDLVLDQVADLEPPGEPVEGVVVESFVDLRANKLTCLLSRAEPRDLVDVMFLDRAGFPPERDLPLALKKDSGIDPAVLAWLLSTFPVEPLPQMLVPLEVPELRRFRDELAERFRRLAVPGGL